MQSCGSVGLIYNSVQNKQGFVLISIRLGFSPISLLIRFTTKSPICPNTNWYLPPKIRFAQIHTCICHQKTDLPKYIYVFARLKTDLPKYIHVFACLKSDLPKYIHVFATKKLICPNTYMFLPVRNLICPNTYMYLLV